MSAPKKKSPKVKPLNSTEIDHMLKDTPGYNGIIMRDEIKKGLKNGFYVLNLDVGNPKTTMGGTHWVALQVTNGAITFIDSYGTGPVQELYAKSVLKGRTLQFTDVQYQPDKSVACGYYAVYFIRKLAESQSDVPSEQGYSILEILENFEPRDSYYNDVVVMSPWKRGYK